MLRNAQFHFAKVKLKLHELWRVSRVMCANQAVSQIIVVKCFTANTDIPAFLNTSLLVYVTDLMLLHLMFSLKPSHNELYIHKLQINQIFDMEVWEQFWLFQAH